MVCKCGKKVYYIRQYEGLELCKKCFVKSIEKKVKKVIRHNKLIESGDKICVALSGGKDSVSCLYILSNIVKKRKDMKIFAITIEEGLGEYRKKTIEKAKKACKLLGVDLKIFSFKEEFGGSLPKLLKKNPNLNACTFCGVLRRHLINKKARELGATKVAFGFNLNDEAESVFLNFIFGNVDKFLRLGPKVENKKIKKFVPRIKPLREILEKEVFAYADAVGLPYYKKKVCPYGKESVRKTIRKTIYELEEKYPGTTYQIVKFADQLITPLRKSFFKEGKIKYCKICEEPSSKEICKVCELLNIKVE
jgi:uncharacterized protein (TIGR00269 family)